MYTGKREQIAVMISHLYTSMKMLTNSHLCMKKFAPIKQAVTLQV